MRNAETLPAWAARQRNRRLVRHSDEKVVRWISRNQGEKSESDTRAGTAPSSNDNLVAFESTRAVQAS